MPPPNYESESFWNSRFKNETHFEWLGDGRETIVPVVRQYLLTHLNNNAGRPQAPRTLHIGAGTSTLSDAILETHHDVFGGQTGDALVVNTDFAEEVVERGKLSVEAVRGEVRWERVDLLSWRDCDGLVKGVKGEGEEEGLFEVVVDKSTSDAISCGEDVSYSRDALTEDSQNSSTHSVIVESVSKLEDGDTLMVEPLELLALHLASLVKPGGVWIALSYSDHRLPFLSSSKHHLVDGMEGKKPKSLDVSRFWELERVEKVDAPSGGNAHAPVIQHHLYVLRRTGRGTQ